MSRRFCIPFLSDAAPSRGLACIQVRSLQTATGGQLSIAADTGMWSAAAETQYATVLFLERAPNRTEHRSIAAFLKPRSVLRRQDRFSVFFNITRNFQEIFAPFILGERVIVSDA